MHQGGGKFEIVYLKGDGTEKRGGETKTLKEGKLGQGVSALKRRGAGTPL